MAPESKTSKLAANRCDGKYGAVLLRYTSSHRVRSS